MENEHIILFGAGKIGKEALDVIGSDYVYAFCDNSVKNGECTEKYGKNVISLDEYCASPVSYTHLTLPTNSLV